MSQEPAVTEPTPPAAPGRSIDYGRYQLRHPWPADCRVQGGGGGLVFKRDGGAYRTAFVEAFPTHRETFIRGEGGTLEEAEDAAWAKYQRVSANDHQHAFVTRGYRNGAGVCEVCGLFQSGVFDLAAIGSVCCVCGVGTYWTIVGGDLYCKEHAPSKDETKELVAAARARGEHVSALQQLLEAIADDED